MGMLLNVANWHRKTCVINKRLDGKLAIVTGANSGIGMVTSAELARRGCLVIMASRNMNLAEAAKRRILTQYGTERTKCDAVSDLSEIRPDQLILEHIDLADLSSVRRFVQRISSKYTTLEYLINNAGLFAPKYEETKDGFEMTMGVNHLGHFVLTGLLLPMLFNSAPSRIINVSSVAHNWGVIERPNLLLSESKFDSQKAYRQSKLANVMHARELARRCKMTGVTAVSLHPGVVQTEFFRNHNSLKLRMWCWMLRPFTVDAWLGSQTTMFTVMVDNLEPGGYYDNCMLKTPHPRAMDEEMCPWLWDKSCELTGCKIPCIRN